MPTVVYQCPSCGAPLAFDAANQTWKCDFCQNEYTQSQLEKTQAHRQQNPAQESRGNGDAYEYACPNCGAKIVADDTTAATYCVFCHTPTILSERLSEQFKPQMVIPFTIDQENAKKAFLAWCKKKHFLPKGFTSPDQIEKMRGIYVPFWLFDCSAQGNLQAMATVVNSWTSGDYQYTRTKYFSVSRAGEMRYHCIPADGSSKMDDGTMCSLEPFNYQGLTNFDMSYLSGFLAERYDVDDRKVYPVIEQRVNQYTVDKLRSTIGPYSSVTIQQSNTMIPSARATNTLLPVWILNYRHRDKTYAFYMNGQTGRITGYAPVSIFKLFRFGGLLWAAITLLLTLARMIAG